VVRAVDGAVDAGEAVLAAAAPVKRASSAVSAADKAAVGALSRVVSAVDAAVDAAEAALAPAGDGASKLGEAARRVLASSTDSADGLLSRMSRAMPTAGGLRAFLQSVRDRAAAAGRAVGSSAAAVPAALGGAGGAAKASMSDAATALIKAASTAALALALRAKATRAALVSATAVASRVASSRTKTALASVNSALAPLANEVGKLPDKVFAALGSVSPAASNLLRGVASGSAGALTASRDFAAEHRIATAAILATLLLIALWPAICHLWAVYELPTSVAVNLKWV